MGLPRVVVPLETVAVRAGVELALITIELWDDVTVFRLSAIRNERTAEIERDNQQAWREWRHAHDGQDVPSPRDPIKSLFDDVNVRITDDAGTRGRLIAGTSGGSGTEWRMEWTFRPGARPDASTIKLTGSVGGERLSHTIRLPRSERSASSGDDS